MSTNEVAIWPVLHLSLGKIESDFRRATFAKTFPSCKIPGRLASDQVRRGPVGQQTRSLHGWVCRSATSVPPPVRIPQPRSVGWRSALRASGDEFQMGSRSSLSELQNTRPTHGNHGQDGAAIRAVTGQKRLPPAAVSGEVRKPVRSDGPVRGAFKIASERSPLSIEV
jgi:hypothetical protein